MEKTWLSPEGYHILMQEREDMLFQAEKMKQHAPCKDISMWPTHHTQPTQPAPSVPDGSSVQTAAPIEMSITTGTLSKMFLRLDGYDKAQPGYGWRKGWNDAIRQAMDYAQPAPSAPDGWKLVPIVSTYDMENAGADRCDGYLITAQAVWDAMIAAAPEAKP